jgi:virginiamycin B lyase
MTFSPRTTGRFGMAPWAGLLVILVSACSPQDTPAASVATEPGALLAGRVLSETGEPVAAVPVQAHRQGSNITVSVYTDKTGAYVFPAWSDVAPGAYDVAVALPDFKHITRMGVALASGKTAMLDFTLQPREPDYSEATAAEIVAALPGTDEQKVLFAQCGNCHTIQHALATARTKEGWAQIIRLMAGDRNVSRDYPGSKTYGQKRFVEPLAEYLASIRGPGSSDQIPFKPRPRPTDDAATRLVVTAYDLPRGGQREIDMLRGDPRFVWPHDVKVDANYAWYTDHFSSVLGRLDKKTGEVTELRYPLPPGGGRDMTIAAGEDRAGNPGGGSHDLLFDSKGDLIIGMDDATVRYDPAKNSFVHWTAGNNMFGLDAHDHVWETDDGAPLTEIDTTTGKITMHKIPTNDGVYDMDTDSKGRTLINIWRNAKIGVYDPATDKYAEYATATPEAGPRRGEIDAQDRLWVTLYYAGRLMRFDPATGEMKEFPLIAGTKAYAAPYTSPYSASVDNARHWVWTNDFNSGRLFRFDEASETFTEYALPLPYEMRDLTVEAGTARPTLWIPSYRPPSQIVKVQVR